MSLYRFAGAISADLEAKDWIHQPGPVDCGECLLEKVAFQLSELLSDSDLKLLKHPYVELGISMADKVYSHEHHRIADRFDLSQNPPLLLPMHMHF